MLNIERLTSISCKATGIGSVPHTDVDVICDMILDKCGDLPYWPQLANIDLREEMMIQYSENLPCIRFSLGDKDVHLDSSSDREEGLVEFYEHYINSDYDYFKISRDYARGFYTLLEKSEKRDNPFIKGQIVGPVTYLYSILGEDGKPLIHDDSMSDAIIRGLAMKAVWQAKEIRKINKEPVIFFDEPSLAGFGSAFMSLERDKVMAIFEKLIDTIREHEEILIGTHCCGNSDWDMILGTGIDIISFDSYAFSKYFVLYPDIIGKYLERGGIVAWGAVPTVEYNDDVTIDDLIKRLDDALDILVSKGIERELLFRNSLITPACGIGLLTEKAANEVIGLTSAIAEHMRQH
ncbi:MAG: hypothetical protein SVZ03_13395 [Spirochaetota bacterium]|nr:hypothetical protein [Spirochaetota bacterium]